MNTKIKNFLKKFPVLKYLLPKKFLRKQDIELISFWIDKYLKDKDLNVVQIGSNDGVTGDPLYKLLVKRSKWKVLLVEPVPYLFEKLQMNYPHTKRFKFANVAVNNGLTQKFYFVNKEAENTLENLPVWYDQLGSFKRDNIIKHLDGRLGPFIEELQIQGTTLGDLLEKYDIEQLELLHIDTEGYDWEILSQLDLKKHKPAIIIFEHKHLSQEDKNKAIAFLNQEYQIFLFSGDFLCVRSGEKLKDKHQNKLKKKLINRS